MLYNIQSCLQYELDEAPSVHNEKDDFLDDKFAPDAIDTPSDDVYNIHHINFNRLPMHNPSLDFKPDPETVLIVSLIVDLFCGFFYPVVVVVSV